MKNRMVNHRALMLLQGYADQKKLSITAERIPKAGWTGSLINVHGEIWLASTEFKPGGYDTFLDLFSALHFYAKQKIEKDWRELGSVEV